IKEVKVAGKFEAGSGGSVGVGMCQGAFSSPRVGADLQSPRANCKKAGRSFEGILKISASNSAICVEGRRSSSSSLRIIDTEHPTRSARASRVRSSAFLLSLSQYPKECCSCINFPVNRFASLYE